MKLYVGTSGFSYKPWKGSFYPEDLSDKKMLAFYGEHFNAVEINSSFRRMPSAASLERWGTEVPEDFRFVLKASQRITHILRLKEEAAEPLRFLVGVAATLGERLGALLFQLPPNLKKDLPRLEAFLAVLPTEAAKPAVAFEFRHASWFDAEVFDLLRAHNAALCIAEAEADLDVPFEATADWGYLRLRMPDYDDAELTQWIERIRATGWREAMVFFKHEDEGKGPKLAKRFMALAARGPR